MESAAVFGSRLSRWIAGLYWLILVFLGAMIVFIPIVAKMQQPEGIFFRATISLAFLAIAFILYRAYKLRFTVTQQEVAASGIFKKIRIGITEISSIQKTPIPIGFRLCGASFLGGWYYLPGIGRAMVAMTNFSDGVMITTKRGKHFVLTPKDPQQFIKEVQSRM